jgi:opacity protein-like surface antigen
VVAQEDQDSTAAADSLQAPTGFAIPVHVVLGFGYGMRNDECVLCESTEEDRSFSAHVSIVRPLWHGFGVGIDASAWRKGRPGTPGALDAEGVPESTSLANMLGNLSVSFSYDYWHLFVRAGAGISFGSQDLEMENQEGDIIVHTASGWGPGYSVGGGVTLPVASVVSLAFYANYNVGQYDMVSPQGVTERRAKHQYLELGVGVALR